KLAGAYVMTTASLRNHEFVRGLGADEVIDYTVNDFAEVASDVDMVLDFIVGLDQQKNCKVLRKGGRVVSIVTPNIAEITQVYGVEGKFVIVQPKVEQLEQIDKWLQQKKLNVHISEQLPLEQTALRQAHSQIETKHTSGKVVIRIR